MDMNLILDFNSIGLVKDGRAVAYPKQWDEYKNMSVEELIADVKENISARLVYMDESDYKIFKEVE